jgi:hypothetical protein
MVRGGILGLFHLKLYFLMRLSRNKGNFAGIIYLKNDFKFRRIL